MQFRKLLGLEPVSVVIKKGRLRWCEYVELDDNANWVKMKQYRRKKTLWDVNDDMKSYVLNHKSIIQKAKPLSSKYKQTALDSRRRKYGSTSLSTHYNIFVCLFCWCLTALSAQIGYIVP